MGVVQAEGWEMALETPQGWVAAVPDECPCALTSPPTAVEQALSGTVPASATEDDAGSWHAQGRSPVLCRSLVR